MNDAPRDRASPAPTPVQRLEASRARLRAALQATPRRGTGSSPDPRHDGRPFTFVDTLARAASQAWARHPLRTALRVLREFAVPAVVQRLKPMAASNPLGLVLAGAGVGAVLVWLRPWRVLPRTAWTSVLLPLVIPRQAIWQTLLDGGLDKLANLDALMQWLDRGRRGAAEPPPTAAKHGVLHPEPPAADAARAA